MPNDYMHVVFLSSGNHGEKNGRGDNVSGEKPLWGSEGYHPWKILKSRVPEMPFPTFWGRFYRILMIIKRRIKYTKDNTFQE